MNSLKLDWTIFFRVKWIFIVFVFAFIFSNKSLAQVEPEPIRYYIETTDGNEFTGILIEQDADHVKLITDIWGEISIPRYMIKKMEVIHSSNMKGGVYWFENPQAARYFWAPNGYSIKAGETYYQNIYVFYNQLSFGVTDYFAFSAGTIPLFLFAGAPTPVWIVPKFSIPVVREKINLGVGALAGVVFSLNPELGGIEHPGFGILFGNATFGPRDKNLSIGVGYGFAGGEMAHRPMVNISAMARISPKSYFLTENYYLPIEDAGTVILMIGGRSFAKRIGIDYGLVMPFTKEMYSWWAFPWLGITVPIGKKTVPPVHNTL